MFPSTKPATLLRLTQRYLLPTLIVTAHWIAPAVLHSQDRQPADLVDDVARLQRLSLEELGWHEKERIEMAGFVELRGSWLGPVYHGPDASGNEVHFQLTESARIWIPTSEAAGTTIHQVVVANHTDEWLNWEVPVHAELASEFPVASIRHAQEASDWTSLGFRHRDHWVNATVDGAMRLGNLCEPGDYEYANFPYSLVKTQIMALTLLSRILEDRGYEPGPAGMFGNSKEGLSTWVASTIDDRLVAIAPGGYPGDPRDWYQSVIDDYGCNAGMIWPVSLASLNSTEGGRTMLKYFSVDEFSEYIKAEFCLMWGDVGLAELHDGKYLMAPSIGHFQETFSATANRFSRLPDLYERETAGERRGRLVGLLAHYLVNRDITTYPEITAATAEFDNEDAPSRFRASATVSPQPESVRLWWSHSTTRAFNEPGNAPYLPVEMVLDGETWVSPWVDIPSDEMIGWFVEAERAIDWDGLQLMQRDASPLRFFNEFPPSPVPYCCPIAHRRPPRSWRRRRLLGAWISTGMTSTASNSQVTRFAVPLARTVSSPGSAWTRLLPGASSPISRSKTVAPTSIA